MEFVIVATIVILGVALIASGIVMYRGSARTGVMAIDGRVGEGRPLTQKEYLSGVAAPDPLAAIRSPGPKASATDGGGNLSIVVIVAVVVAAAVIGWLFRRRSRPAPTP